MTPSGAGETGFRTELIRMFGQDFGAGRWQRPPIALRFQLATGDSMEIAESRCFQLLESLAGSDECWIELTSRRDPEELRAFAAESGLAPAGAWELEQVRVDWEDENSEWRLSQKIVPSPESLRSLARVSVHTDRDVTFRGLRVYLLNPASEVLIHPYDDRGADIYAPRIDALRPFYDRFGDWLLPFNREGAERMISDATIPSWPDPFESTG